MLVYENDIFVYNIKEYKEFVHFYCRHKIYNHEWSKLIYDTEEWINNCKITYQEKYDNKDVTIILHKNTDIVNIKIIRLDKHKSKNVFMFMYN